MRYLKSFYIIVHWNDIDQVYEEYLPIRFE